MSTFHLTIASIGETKFDGDAQSAIFPGSDGEFTVLAHHEPLVSTLKPGHVHVRDAAGVQHAFNITTGVVEVSANHAIVLI
ncbi:F0F1 ATP synthase subunit epsilon [Candidatus Kaiserbacteria bacterium]|nr:F0F1 ATP synthase subunit epsilon [Candidatus Kaiserbacteria bacterium]